MATEPYEEIVGQPQQLDEGDPYVATGADQRSCPPAGVGGCGAVAGEKCTFESEEYRQGLGMVKVTLTRHSPCLVRMNRKEGP